MDALLDRYQEVTRAALEMAHKAPRKDSRAAEVLDMAQRYYDDAQYFLGNGDKARALAALSYAHGWLDCGARLGLYVVKDDKLFTVDAEK